MVLKCKIPSLQIGDLTAKLPVVQGGMGVGISLSGLASAVANEGGVGVISATGIGMLEPDFNRDHHAANERALRREIKKARQQTKGILGINVMVALADHLEMMRIAIEEKIDIIFAGAGLPLKVSDNFFSNTSGARKTKLIPIVSSGRAARLIFQSWQKKYNQVPDGIVVEGPLAGGHLGFKLEQLSDPDVTLENILPEVIAEIKPYEDLYQKQIPVIAAGGIFTGADIHRMLEIGADGVQMATRFVGTHECDASLEFKETYIKSRKEDIVIIKSPVGLPGRAIYNRFLEEVSQGKKIPYKCHWRCLRTCDVEHSQYCIVLALTNAKRGLLDKGFAFAGANAYLVKKLVSVKEVFQNLVDEYCTAVSTVAIPV